MHLYPLFVIIIFISSCKFSNSYLLQTKVMTKSVMDHNIRLGIRCNVGEDGTADLASQQELKMAKLRADYEEKLLRDAMQVTQNQQTFFSVGKYLIPVVIVVWLYAIFSGSIFNTAIDVQ